MSTRDSTPPGPTTIVGPAEVDHQETRHQTERPPQQREGVVSDPDQYFPELLHPAKHRVGP